MKTVLYAGGFRLPDGNAAALRVLGNAKILRRLGYNVVFLDVSDNAENDVLKTVHEVCGFTCYSVKYPKGIKWYNYLTSIKNIRKLTDKYENIKLIVLYNYPAAAMSRLLKFSKKTDIKLVADSTEWYPKSHNLIKNIDTYARMQLFQPRCDGVIAISKYLYDFYCKYTETVRIPPLVDPAEEKWKVNDFQNDDIVFTYSGSPGRHKDKINLFIDAFSEISTERKFRMNIIGITKQQYIKWYPQQNDALEKLSKKVVFMGKISHLEALTQLKNSTFSVFVRKDDLTATAGFPTKYAEAVSCGIPVITNLTGDLGLFVKDCENGFVIENCDACSVKKTLTKALSLSNEKLQLIRLNCRKNANEFCYENYTDAMGKFLDAVMNE